MAEHATWHRPHDPALASGIRSLAAAVSGWVRTATSPGTLAADGADAVAAAAAGRVATLVVPAGCQWEPGGEPAEIIIARRVRAR